MWCSRFIQIYAFYWLRPASSAFSFVRKYNWLGCHNDNEMRNAKCADYCLFPILCLSSHCGILLPVINTLFWIRRRNYIHSRSSYDILIQKMMCTSDKFHYNLSIICIIILIHINTNIQTYSRVCILCACELDITTAEKSSKTFVQGAF